MAFKFNCEHCGEELTVYYLKKGEEAQCTACARQTLVPETAEFFEKVTPEWPGPPIEQDNREPWTVFILPVQDIAADYRIWTGIGDGIIRS